MKMAKASEVDLETAMKLCNVLESLQRYGNMPTLEDDDCEDAEPFDEYDGEDCKKALGVVLDLFGRASLFRVVFGMAVVLDPRNAIIDPDADTLEIHPDIRSEQVGGARYRWLRDSGSNWIAAAVEAETRTRDPRNYDWPNTLDAIVDSLMTPNAEITGAKRPG